MKKKLQRIAVVGLAALFFCACSSDKEKTPAAAPEEEKSVSEELSEGSSEGVSEEFAAVVHDFSVRYKIMDLEGRAYENILEVVDAYLNREITKDQALESLHFYQKLLQDREEKTRSDLKVGEALAKNLKACSISPEEYEMFVNMHKTDLYQLNQQVDILEQNLKNAVEGQPVYENLQFTADIDRQLLEIEKESKYYKDFNYWFYTADESQYDYLEEKVISELQCYIPESPVWYTSEEEINEKVSAAYDEMEEIIEILAKKAGEEQNDLYDLEQKVKENASE